MHDGQQRTNVHASTSAAYNQYGLNPPFGSQDQELLHVEHSAGAAHNRSNPPPRHATDILDHDAQQHINSYQPANSQAGSLPTPAFSSNFERHVLQVLDKLWFVSVYLRSTSLSML